MKKIFDIFKIKKEERVSALVALIIACALNALTVIKYHSQFSQITDNYHKLFVKTFHVAGFDPLTYSIVSHWDTEYNVYRHPLLAFFMYIPNQINQGLIMLTGINCVQFVVGAILVFCAFYSFIFLYRIFREVIGTERFDANLLSAFYFSFAYVMVSAMIPDHFIMSMIILLCTLYITGVCMKKGRQLTIWQTILLFVFSWARTMTCHPMSPFSILPATYTRARQVTCSRQHVSATVPSTRSTTMSISTVLP